jgi:hypothetical protein
MGADRIRSQRMGTGEVGLGRVVIRLSGHSQQPFDISNHLYFEYQRSEKLR